MPNALQAGQSVPQIRSQVNISGQQPRLQNQLALNSTRIASSTVLQQQARALQAAQAQQQGHPGVSQSLAAGAAPALNPHLSPPFNTQRTASTSPGLGQQSPPPAAAQNTATSPRPPSAQAQAPAQAQAQAQAQAHMNTAQQAQAPIAQQRSFNQAAIANYYASIGAAHGTSQFTQEQLAQAHVRMILQQVRLSCFVAGFVCCFTEDTDEELRAAGVAATTAGTTSSPSSAATATTKWRLPMNWVLFLLYCIVV